MNLFEISNRVLKFENLIQIWKSFIPSENLFQTWALQGGAMCMYSTLSRDKLENMNMVPLSRVHVWHKFFRFELSFQLSKFDLRFWKKSNRFSRDKSFGHFYRKYELYLVFLVKLQKKYQWNERVSPVSIGISLIQTTE